MRLESIIYVVVLSIVRSRGYKNFSNFITHKCPMILNFLNSWSLEYRKYHCTLITKTYMFLYGIKTFPTCKNPKCSTKILNVLTFKQGFPECCSFKCRGKILSVQLQGAQNPNYGHKWSKAQKQCASLRSKKQMEDYEHRFVLNQPKTEQARISKSNKISLANKGKKPWIAGKKHSVETKQIIGKKSAAKFTKTYKENIRKKNEDNGLWIPLSQKTDKEIYYQESNWISRMFDLITDQKQVKLLQTYGIYSHKNTNGVVRDHIYSRRSGFLNGVFPQILRHPCNCQIILQRDNTKKAHSLKNIDKFGIDNQQSLQILFEKIKSYSGIWIEQQLCLQLIEKYQNGYRWKNLYK